MKIHIALFTFSLAFFVLIGCGNSKKGDASASSDTLATKTEEATPRSITPEDTFIKTQSNAQRIAPNFSIANEFPVFYKLLAENEHFSFVEFLEVYALPALHPEEIRSEAGLLSIFQSRKNILIGLTSVFSQIPTEKIEAQLPLLQKEFGRIGIELKTDNGSYAEFRSGEAFEGIISTYATDPFTHFRAFIKAQEKALTGEFPYTDMEPYQDMVVAGEKLMTEFPNSAHYQAIRTDFREALRNFVGIFVLQEGGYTSERLDNPMVDSERNATETETHKQFVANHASSRYAPIVKKMLEMQSLISKRPENVYAIYAGTASSLEEAREKQFELINQGEDVLHLLPFDAGTQQETYLLAYRFFEDEESSLKCLDATQKAAKIKVSYMNLSINGNRMYQMGI